MLCESARWGDASPGRGNRPRTRDVHWKRARDYVLDLMDGNVERFVQTLRDHDYYPTLDPPGFERASDSITIRRPAGAEKVYYTLDGSDPQNPTAHSFSEAVSTVPFSPNLKGRSRRGDEWSALNEYGDLGTRLTVQRFEDGGEVGFSGNGIAEGVTHRANRRKLHVGLLDNYGNSRAWVPSRLKGPSFGTGRGGNSARLSPPGHRRNNVLEKERVVRREKLGQSGNA